MSQTQAQTSGAPDASPVIEPAQKQEPAFDYSPGHISAIEAAMSIDRLSPYVAMAGGDKVKAFRFYERNTLLSESLYGPIQAVEIVFRNAFHKQLLAHFGPAWYHDLDANDVLNPRKEADIPGALLKLRNARETLQRKNKPETASQIVSELSFGFWVSLASKRHMPELWFTCLFRPFKGFKGGRAAIYDRLESIRGLRNRIAHHEPILPRDLNADYANILEAVRWVCGATATWVAASSSFPERFAKPI